MFDPVNHHSTHFVDSSPLSRRSARCLLTQLPFITDNFRCLFFIRSRRFVRSARCSFLGFALAPQRLPIRSPHLCRFRLRCTRLFDFSSFFALLPFLIGPLSTFPLASYAPLGLPGPGMVASIPFSIRLSSAADLNETPLRLSIDPFSFAPCILSIFQFLMVHEIATLLPIDF